MLSQIEYCLQQDCVVCIEHAATMTPRWSPWETWRKPCYYDGDIHRVYSEIDRCRDRHADHYIRLNIEGHSCHSRFSFVVHTPS
ncbi:ribulose bisphosphate carboxylase small subunit, partial [Imhoffiella purpurea]|uniref:Ribulose bisphosphate carboxylase small subunit domain-containing protein n=1 Tax=Imhoffiella purpurea TaxID=1249627 RepID=W9VDV7_9GAMM